MSAVVVEDVPGRERRGTYRTLVVDDVADLRELYRHILERTGRFVVVGEAGDGLEAVALATRLQPDLVILDVSMPERDGMEVLPEVLAAAEGATVVMLSGFESSRLRPLALERGAVAYLEKGITPDRLVRELLQALGGDLDDGPASAAVVHDRRATDGADMTPEELLSFVAHEIRNPLSVVYGFADTLLAEVDELSSEEIRHFSGRIAANARYLDGIVSSVLQLRQIAQGDLLLERTTVPPGRLLSDLVEQLRTEVPQIVLELRCARTMPAMSVDPQRFRQVLTNLVGNAARYSPQGGTVRVEAVRDGGEIVVSVQDEGPGIPPDDRDRVFERFVRLEQGGTGVGLGLYISRALVEAMGGTIRVADSEVGARIAVRLPVADG